MKRFIPGIAILLILSLTACSAPKTPPKDTGDASNSQSEGIIRLDEGEWPVNEYTEGLPVPTGTVAWAMLDTEHGNFSISIAGIDEKGYDNYMELLIQEGFSVVENVSEKIKGENYVSVGTLLSNGEKGLSISYIVSNLNAALSTWNDKLTEIWSLLTESPQTFKGGQVWGVMTGIHGALQAIGYGLLVLFFAVGVMKTCGSFVEVKKPEHALKLFIRFALAKGAVTYGLELMLAVFSIAQGMVSTIITQSGSSGMSSVSLPQELIDAINNVGFWDSIPLWAVTLIGGLLITVLSFTMILTVYGRMFSLWMYAAIAPIPLSTFAGEPTSSVGKNFIRSYAGVCLQGVVIALSCIIFSAISSSPPAVDTGASVVTAVWTYVGELAFNLLVLVGAIKGCDRIVKEIMGL